MLLVAAFAGLVSVSQVAAGCPPETYFTEKDGSVAHYNGNNVIYFDVVVRRYSQITATCQYKQWIQTIGGHATEVEYSVFSPSYGISSIAILQDRGAITWNAISWTKHDTEVFSIYSGCAINKAASCDIAHTGMGSPIPGEVDHFYRTNSLPSAYYGQSMKVLINVNLLGSNWPMATELVLLPPP